MIFLQHSQRRSLEAPAQKEQRIEELDGMLMGTLLRLEELERRLAKDSHTSSKPPSSDGLARKGKRRPKSGKPSGGQLGHQGHALQQVAKPNAVIAHRPSHCVAVLPPECDALLLSYFELLRQGPEQSSPKHG